MTHFSNPLSEELYEDVQHLLRDGATELEMAQALAEVLADHLGSMEEDEPRSIFDQHMDAASAQLASDINQAKSAPFDFTSAANTMMGTPMCKCGHWISDHNGRYSCTKCDCKNFRSV